jgi:hypothetical protein
MTMAAAAATRAHHSSQLSFKSVLVLIALAVLALLSVQFGLSGVHNFSSSDHLLSASKQEFFKTDANTDSRAALPWKSKDDLMTARINTKAHASAFPNETTSPHYYMVFSTSCSPQQHWESLVFFYHAFRVGQPGNVTRIVAGCTDEEAADLVAFHATYISAMSDKFHVHFTPNYATVRKVHGKHAYKYMNKPYGLRHWLENALGLMEETTVDASIRDSIVMLLDPDMILLRPLIHDFTDEHVMWIDDDPVTKVVKHGFPIAQQDGESCRQHGGMLVSVTDFVLTLVLPHIVTNRVSHQ